MDDGHYSVCNAEKEHILKCVALIHGLSMWKKVTGWLNIAMELELHKMPYCKISQSFEGVRFLFRALQVLWILASLRHLCSTAAAAPAKLTLL